MDEVLLLAGTDGEVGIEPLLGCRSSGGVVGLRTAIGGLQLGCCHGTCIGCEGIHPCGKVLIGIGIVALEGVGFSTVEDECIGGKGRHNHLGIALAIDNVGIFHILSHLVESDLGRAAHLRCFHVDFLLGTPETSAVDGLGIRNTGAVAIALGYCRGTVDPGPIGVGADNEQIGFLAGIDEGIVLRTACRQCTQGFPVAHHVGR